VNPGWGADGTGGADGTRAAWSASGIVAVGDGAGDAPAAPPWPAAGPAPATCTARLLLDPVRRRTLKRRRTLNDADRPTIIGPWPVAGPGVAGPVSPWERRS